MIRLLPRSRAIIVPDFFAEKGYAELTITAGLVDVDVYPELRKHTVNPWKCGICNRMNGRHRSTCAYRPERRHP